MRLAQFYVEPSCCKKRQKSPNQETGLGNRGRMNALNNTKLILEVTHAHLGIIQNLQTSPIPQTSFLVGTSFDTSYSKTALDCNICRLKMFGFEYSIVIFKGRPTELTFLK